MLGVAVYARDDHVMSVMGCGLLWRRAALGWPSAMNGCKEGCYWQQVMAQRDYSTTGDYKVHNKQQILLVMLQAFPPLLQQLQQHSHLSY